jgi:DNA-binding protein H-NS
MKAQHESHNGAATMSTVLDKLKALDAQRDQLLADAKKEAITAAEKAISDLNELGFHYTLTEGATTPSSSPAKPRKTASKTTKRAPRDLPCPICEFKTTPHHDGRLHRNQKTKEPFTVEELMEKHLTKVG